MRNIASRSSGQPKQYVLGSLASGANGVQLDFDEGNMSAAYSTLRKTECRSVQG